jgi:hypothetical protein
MAQIPGWVLQTGLLHSIKPGFIGFKPVVAQFELVA